MAQSMTVEVREAFLAGLHVGLVSLAAPSGAPAVTPVWYAYTPGGEVRILTALNGPLPRTLPPRRHPGRGPRHVCFLPCIDQCPRVVPVRRPRMSSRASLPHLLADRPG